MGNILRYSTQNSKNTFQQISQPVCVVACLLNDVAACLNRSLAIPVHYVKTIEFLISLECEHPESANESRVEKTLDTQMKRFYSHWSELYCSP